ncbi:hypothetical protein ASPWEDRAFT_109295 [Aspergillus wentii DTO 134E9]|uniref:Chalcone isomerase domain-containing protein n=1 Tax=Aspergillus wentii DTO 134E9 TaxID=1073089 RepID=A0A1L9RP00_ASPWE|nr:uncharacterized protein ASPWEDRAFT_109295 [Aspergillus wentii DTO 134E9]KAI9934238.1 Altered inheritance of mitochondria protein 18 mitochondrial [Aspergillus wentii]OJJ36622.1 hypothetical protein ASPWEDRAFT_109295 [Aspergillus wentii DTO 134E9]
MASPSAIQGSAPWRACGQCIRRQYLRSGPARSQNRFLSTTNPLRSAGNNPLRSPTTSRARAQDAAKSRRSMMISVGGIAACAVAMYGVIALDPFGLPKPEKAEGKDEKVEGSSGDNKNGAMKMDGPDGFPSNASVIRIQGQDGVEEVATGTSSVPYFPSTMKLPKSIDSASIKPNEELGPAEEEEEYQLLGLGIRTVSFLRIQVYVVGLYVAKSDITELQRRLVRTAVNPPGEGQAITGTPGAGSATSLVSGERQQLKELLLDADKGDAAWDAILKQEGLRTAFRIVPTRNTDFLHLRDGWVRGITGRAQKANAKVKESGSTTPGEFGDDSFGPALSEFKALFGGGQRKNVPKGETLLLVRNANGDMDALFHPDPTKPMRWLGRVSDERISRLVWLNYLAGKNVSSEGARQSVVDGIMGIVERPVGTVVQKVI